MVTTKISYKENILAPKLRFKGYADSWKKGTIGDYYGNLRTGMTPSRTRPDYFRGDIPWISSGELNYHFIEKTAESITQEAIANTNLKIYPPNTLFIAITGLEAPGTRGKCAMNKVPAATNQSCLAFEKVANVSTLFLFQWYKKNGIGLYFNFAQGTKQQSFNNKLVRGFTFNIPSLPEQQKIASFLSAVDEKILLLIRKKALIEQYKKGVMQQLFSGELRFKDEKGKAFPKWEVKRLDEVVSRFIVPMRDKPKDLTGSIPWCRIEDFDGKYLSKSKSGQGVDIATIKEMNLKVYPVGTLLVSCSANLGFCAITKTELMTNQTFIGLVPNDKKVDVLFLYYVMRKSSAVLNTLSSGTTISYLSREQFEKFKIPYPSLLEQKKLASYISKLDDKIDGLDKQITQTQTFKKGLLQQMFV